MERRWLSSALLAALIVAGIALAFRVVGDAALPGRSMAGLLPLLFAAAGLCTAGLLRHRSPAGAWLAIVSVAGISALEVLGAVRARLPTTSPGVSPWLVVMAGGAILAAASVAALYAARSPAGRRPTWFRPWRAIVLASLAGIAVLVGTAVAGTAFGSPADPAATLASEQSPFRISTRLAAGFIAVLTMVGALRDLAGPIRRARSHAHGLRDWPAALTEELLPAAGTMRRIGRDEERARLAADLHAFVLPDLRRAADAAARSRDRAGEPVAAELRQALAGLEQVMHERQSVVLEEFGLVAALEWLAERTQDHSDLGVDIELEGDLVGDSTALPRDVERVAFRVAMLAMDNVVRHAAASRVVVRLFVDGSAASLRVTDDGHGIDRARSARGGRGLVDMRTAAAEIGATLRVDQSGQGTRVELAWSPRGAVAGHHAVTIVDSAGRRQTTAG